jgi:hypothetical protein
VAYRLTESTVLRAGGGTFYTPSTARFPDGPTGNPVNQRTNNIATSVDNIRTFFTDMSNPFPNGVENYPGRDPATAGSCSAARRSSSDRDETGYPGGPCNSTSPYSISSRINGRSRLPSSALRGSHLPNTVNMNQLGLDHVNRAANDTTVLQLDEQRDYSAGGTWLRVDPAGYVLRRVPAANRAESVRGDHPRGGVVDGQRASAIFCWSTTGIFVREPAGLFRLEHLQRAAVESGQALRAPAASSARITRSPELTATWKR